MQIASALKRLIVRKLLRLSVDNSSSLLAEIQAFADARYTDTKEGRFLTSSTGGGYSAVFTFFGSGITPNDMAEVAEELESLYELCVSLLGGSPTDAQIRDEMIDRLQPVTEIYGDYTNLRQRGGLAV